MNIKDFQSIDFTKLASNLGNLSMQNSTKATITPEETRVTAILYSTYKILHYYGQYQKKSILKNNA